MQFCIRDDDTSYFTSADELERVYGRLSQCGPVSLAVVPFHRAGTSRGVPEPLRGRWSVHPLHENSHLVEYLRERVSAGRFEIMLHGYYHDEPHGRPEFAGRDDLRERVREGRRYLEELLGGNVRMFVPPRNCIGSRGLRAIAAEGLHLAGTAGIRRGWAVTSPKSWSAWWRLRRWRHAGGRGVPWVLDLGDHREIAGNAITPLSTAQENETAFDSALALGGIFCAATHYWEQAAPSLQRGEPSVGEQLRRLTERAMADPRVAWQSVGEVVCRGGRHRVNPPGLTHLKFS